MPTIEDLEKLRQQEQARIDLAMGAGLRNRTGQFSTPRNLADEILAYCWELWQGDRRVRFLEPCVGTGSFFSSLCRTFLPESIGAALGCEVDEQHAKVARKLWKDHGLQVKQVDFLRQEPPKNKYNLLITNPPYVRHHHLAPDRKQALQRLVQEHLRLRISGLAGLYCYFLLLADSWLDNGALSAWLIPSEFMDVNYGSVVKEYLSRRVRLLHIHRFCPTDVQFDDALVSSAVVVFEKAAPSGQLITFSVGGSLRCPVHRTILRHDELAADDKWTKYADAAERQVRKPRSSIMLGDLFIIKRGLATGNNDFFILPKEKAKELGLPPKFLLPILPSPRRITDAIVESDAEGYPELYPQLALLHCELSEDEVARRFPQLWDYLLAGKAKRFHETYLTSRRTPWYSQEHRPAAPFLCTYMGRNSNGRKPFRFIWNKSQATAPNVYLLLYPKAQLQAVLKRDPSLYHVLFHAFQMLDADVFKKDGRVYGGGLFKMEPKELASIPADSLARTMGLALEIVPSQQPGLFDDLAK